jgi:hypothetical protein
MLIVCSASMNDIPPPIQTVLDLFATRLADVRFADLDAETLAHAAADVHAASEIVASAQAALDAARGTLQERQDALLSHAQRALAYARVYAESDDGLSAQLDEIALPRPARRPRGDAAAALVLSVEPQPAPRRGRPRKAAPAEPILDHVVLAATDS